MCEVVSVRLFHATGSKTARFYSHSYYRPLIGSPMLQVEPTGQCGHVPTRSAGRHVFVFQSTS